MGFSPLEGLMMGSRSGDIDPNVINYMLKVSKFQKQILFFSFAPKNVRNYFLISALASKTGQIINNEGTLLYGLLNKIEAFTF